jgi:hypothetical protein
VIGPKRGRRDIAHPALLASSRAKFGNRLNVRTADRCSRKIQALVCFIDEFPERNLNVSKATACRR